MVGLAKVVDVMIKGMTWVEMVMLLGLKLTIYYLLNTVVAVGGYLTINFFVTTAMCRKQKKILVGAGRIKTDLFYRNKPLWIYQNSRGIKKKNYPNLKSCGAM